MADHILERWDDKGPEIMHDKINKQGRVKRRLSIKMLTFEAKISVDGLAPGRKIAPI